MCSRGVLVHYPSRLGTAVAVLAAEFLCGNGMFTERTHERAKTVHYFDGVMSHNFKYRRLSKYDSELKFPSLLVKNESRCHGIASVLSLWGVSPPDSGANSRRQLCCHRIPHDTHVSRA